MSRTKTGTRGSNPLLSARSPALIALALLSACASRSLTIQSDPAGGDVYVDGEYKGVAPVTIPFVYGGERKIAVYPPKGKPGGKLYRPKRFLYDTTKDQYDLPIIDIAADVAGGDDKQTVKVKLDETNDAARYDVDADAFRAGARARANTLRVRAREFQLSALPTAAGRDPGPLESRPESRTAEQRRQ